MQKQRCRPVSDPLRVHTPNDAQVVDVLSRFRKQLRRPAAAITVLPKPTEDCHVFHAGTRLDGKRIVTNGGRVLCVTALGGSLKMARARAYETVDAIRFDGMQLRRDIGHRALKKG